MTAVAATSRDIRDVPLTLIDPHPFNRKWFNPIEMATLISSVRAKGVHTICLVRPHKKGRFQLIAGERRAMASRAANLETLPCEVRDLGDEEALELLITENLDREDVHPLAEAEQYEALIKEYGYNRKKIVERVKRSDDYVRDRLKLLALTKHARQLYREGRFEHAHATILARLSPADQARAIGTADGDVPGEHFRIDGLFTRQHTLWTPEALNGGDVPGKDDPWLEVKPVSPKEFEAWVAENVRFDHKIQDLADFFPETAELLTEVPDKTKVLYLTTNHIPRPEAKLEGVRTIGAPHWKRADGERGSKKCQHARAGVITSGPGRGEAFLVCINKEKCPVHWKAEMAERARRAKARENGGAEAKREAREDTAHERYARQQRQENEERERWVKARPALREALVATLDKLAVTVAGPIGQLVFKHCLPYDQRKTAKAVSAKAGAEGIVRHLAYAQVMATLESSYQAPREGPALLKGLGIDAKKIVDEAAPKPEPEKPTSQTSAKPKKGKKKLAGDVRRARGKKKAKATK